MMRRFLLFTALGALGTGCKPAEESAKVAPEPPKPVSTGSSVPQKPTPAGDKASPSDKGADASVWTTSWRSAKAQASQSGRDLLMNFTGSDWCRYCQILHREVFGTPEFKAAIGQNFVPVLLDFPMEDSSVPPEVAAQNAQLQSEFRVQGYPTIFLADASGKPYARTGYREGGVELYLKHLGELRSTRQRRDDAFARAGGLQGLERAAALKQGLEAMEEPLVVSFYAEILREISQLDSKDTLGVEARFGFGAAFEEFQKELGKHVEKGSGALVQLAEAFMQKRDQASAGQKQEVCLAVLARLTPPQDNQAALGLLGRIRDLDPESENGKMAAQNYERLKERMAQSRSASEEGGKPGSEGREASPVPKEK